MRIAIMGAGALGAYFGGRLHAAGHRVSLIARGPHLRAMQENGIRIESLKGDLQVQGVDAVEDPGKVGPVDVVMFMVKSYDVEAGARAIAPMLGPQTMVVTCQNGVSAPDRLAAIIGTERVVPGVARLPATVTAPGVVRHGAKIDIFQFGERDGRASDRCLAFRDALAGAGTMPELVDNIEVELWMKFTMQATLASLCTLLRLDIGPIRDVPDTADLFRAGMEETAAVARARVPGMPGDAAARMWEFFRTIPDDIHASMLDDLLRGKRIENDYLSGDVVRIGREAGVPTPIHEVFWRALRPFEAGGA